MRRVLVVDDERDIRDLLAAALAEEGYAVRVACDGAQALDVAHEARPDVVLLDLMMPGMDGWAFLRARRDIPHLADVPVLVLSAVAGTGFGSGRELDVAGSFAKPFDLDTLVDAVARAADEQSVYAV